MGNNIGNGTAKDVLEPFNIIKMAYSYNYNAGVGIINIFAGNKTEGLLLGGG